MPVGAHDRCGINVPIRAVRHILVCYLPSINCMFKATQTQWTTGEAMLKARNKRQQVCDGLAICKLYVVGPLTISLR